MLFAVVVAAVVVVVFESNTLNEASHVVPAQIDATCGELKQLRMRSSRVSKKHGGSAGRTSMRDMFMHPLSKAIVAYRTVLLASY